MRWLRPRLNADFIIGILVVTTVVGVILGLVIHSNLSSSEAKTPPTSTSVTANATPSATAMPTSGKAVATPPPAKQVIDKRSLQVLLAKAKQFEEEYGTYSYKDTVASHQKRIGTLASPHFLKEEYATILSAKDSIQGEKFFATRRWIETKVSQQFVGDASPDGLSVQVVSLLEMTSASTSDALQSEQLQVTTVFVRPSTTSITWQAYSSAPS